MVEIKWTYQNNKREKKFSLKSEVYSELYTCNLDRESTKHETQTYEQTRLRAYFNKKDDIYDNSGAALTPISTSKVQSLTKYLRQN